MQILSNALKAIPIACKVIYVVSFVLYVIGFIINAVPLAIANYPEKVLNDYELYRLLVTFFSKGPSVFSIISIFADILWIRFFLTNIEKTYSSVYFIIEIFVQNLILQILFTLLGGILLKAGILTSFLISYGWTSLILIFLLKIVYKNEEEKFKIICFDVQKKHLLLFIAIVSIACGFDQFISILVSIVLGFLQFAILKRRLIKLPIGFYKKIDSWMPNAIKQRQDYFKVQDVESNIAEQCAQCKSEQKQVKNQKNQLSQDNAQQNKQNNSKQKKPKKIRKTGRNRNNNNNNSVELKDEGQSGKGTKEGDTDIAPQLPNVEIQTNQELQKNSNL